MICRDELLSLLERLVMAHSPPGNETEIVSIILDEFQ